MYIYHKEKILLKCKYSYAKFSARRSEVKLRVLSGIMREYLVNMENIYALPVELSYGIFKEIMKIVIKVITRDDGGARRAFRNRNSLKFVSSFGKKLIRKRKEIFPTLWDAQRFQPPRPEPINTSGAEMRKM